mgnify:CR=1 FL=1
MDNVTIVENCNDAAIADWLAARLGDALSASTGPVTITVPGGSTPFPIIEALLAHDLDWTRLVVWPGDDRVVHEKSRAARAQKCGDATKRRLASTTREEMSRCDNIFYDEAL